MFDSCLLEANELFHLILIYLEEIFASVAKLVTSLTLTLCKRSYMQFTESKSVLVPKTKKAK